MQKKIKSLLVMLSLVFCLVLTSLMNVQAEGAALKKVCESYLTFNEYAEGKTSSGISTRGKFMMDGMCSITKSGVGKIYAYVSTTADYTVDYLAAVAYVEKYNERDDAWDLVTSWQVEKTNDYYVSSAKIVYVDRGYYYRVRADHVCGNNNEPYDEEFSFTDGIFIP